MLSQAKDEIRRYWNGRARDYSKEAGHGFNSAEEYGLWSAAISRNLPANNGTRALDLGTGPGYVAIMLGKLGYEATGLDMSEEMLTLARQKSKEAGVEVDFQQGDVEAPPFEDNSMDVVICRHIMWTLTDLKKVVAKWKAILKENGHLVVIDGIWDPKTIEGRLRKVAGNLIRTIKNKKLPANWRKKYVSDRRLLPYLGGASSQLVIETFRDVGFRNIKHDPLEDIMAFERHNGPLDYRIQFGHNPRYLISGIK